MNIGFTGTRNGMNPRQLEMFEEVFEGLFRLMTSFAHGDCIGSDKQAHDKAMKHPIDIHIFPPICKIYANKTFENMGYDHWELPPHKKYRIKAMPNGEIMLISPSGIKIYFHKEEDYLKRDRLIVKMADILIATPGQDFEKIRSGTWYTIRRAREKKIPIWKIYPNAKVEVENRESLTIQIPLL